MCSAQSTFFYGVFIKTAYLCFASDAYKKIKNSLLAVDLICARRRKGTLSTRKGHKSVERLPEEVWKMIKPHIGRLAMLEAEQRAVSDYIGSYSCDDEEEWEYAHEWEGGMMNDMALDAFFNSGGMSEMFGSRIGDVKTLLEDFGLALPFTEPYSKNESSSFDLDCLSAISLPLHSTASAPAHLTRSFPFASLEPSADYGSMHEAVKFSKQTFVISPAAEYRIKSFLSYFRLEAKSDQMETVYRPEPIEASTSESQVTESKTVKKKDSEATRKAAHQAVCCSGPDAEPHWHMWTVSHCY